jgi:hypothetical protein
MSDSLGDRAFPFEIKVALARLHRQPRHLGGREAARLQVFGLKSSFRISVAQDGTNR